MSVNAVEAVIHEGEIVCSRCRSVMHPELIFHQDLEEQALLMWRCMNGHPTRSLPVPKTFPLVTPRL